MSISVRSIGKQLISPLATIQTKAVKRAAEYEIEQVILARYEPLELKSLELTPTQREQMIINGILRRKKNVSREQNCGRV